MGDAQIVVHRIVTLATNLGNRQYTDLVMTWEGEHYGNRYLGALGPAQAQIERASFQRRREAESVERNEWR